MKRNNKHFNIPDSKIQNKKFVFTFGERGNGRTYFLEKIKKERENGK